VTHASRPLLELENKFFNEERPGNGSLDLFCPIHSMLTRKYHCKVPVIAIFTKFDLITQVYDIDLEDDENRTTATNLLKENLQNPLFASRFPPKAHVCMEGMDIRLVMWMSISQPIIHIDMQSDDGNHQEQVKELMKETADSLDNLALKMLFVSVQQNNLELCIENAARL
jgi:hypothetical protein